MAKARVMRPKKTGGKVLAEVVDDVAESVDEEEEEVVVQEVTHAAAKLLPAAIPKEKPATAETVETVSPRRRG